MIELLKLRFGLTEPQQEAQPKVMMYKRLPVMRATLPASIFAMLAPNNQPSCCNSSTLYLLVWTQPMASKPPVVALLIRKCRMPHQHDAPRSRQDHLTSIVVASQCDLPIPV